MDLSHKSKIMALMISCVAFLLVPPLFPFLRLYYFTPFLIIVYYQMNFLNSLWWSFICGLLFDIFSSPFFPGLNALIYTLATAILYHQRIYFFSDSLSTMPLMTFFFSFLATIFFWGFVYILGSKIQFTGELLYTDLIVMPVIDALYAFACFVAPSFIFMKKGRRRRDYFGAHG